MFNILVPPVEKAVPIPVHSITVQELRDYYKSLPCSCPIKLKNGKTYIIKEEKNK